LLSRDPALGTPVDEDRLEEKLVGAPTTVTTNVDLETNRIFSINYNHESDDTPLTATTLGKWQSEDTTIREVIAGHRWECPTRNTRSAQPKTDKYVLSDGILRVNVGSHTPVVIPKTKIQHVIWRCHDHVLSNHPGWKETYRAVRQRYYWKGQKMTLDYMSVRVTCARAWNRLTRVRTTQCPANHGKLSVSILCAHAHVPVRKNRTYW